LGEELRSVSSRYDDRPVVTLTTALANIYNAGKLSAEEKQAILAKKAVLKKYAHTDEGVDCHHRDFTHYETDFTL
jgi:hypothetical protein